MSEAMVNSGMISVAEVRGSMARNGSGSGIAANEASQNHDSIVLALPSSMCFSFSKTNSELKQLKNRSLILYELEEYLPVDADDLAFARIDSRVGALLVAADGGEIEPSLLHLSSDGRYVAAISPTVFLAFSELRREHALRQIDLIVWQSDEGIDLLHVVGGIPVQWRWCDPSGDSVSTSLASLELTSETIRVILISVTEPSVRDCFGDAELDELSLVREVAAGSECDRITRGSSNPVCDLRDGPLASSEPNRAIAMPMRVFLVAFLFIQLSVATAALLRGWLYRQETAALVSIQEETFRRVVPEEPIPVGIVSRLQSEHRRLSGTRGVSDQQIPKLRSSIPTAHALLSALPEPTVAKYTIDRVELRPQELSIATGTAKSYGDLEQVAQRLRTAGFAVPPLSWNKTPDGVTLRFEELGLSGGGGQ